MAYKQTPDPASSFMPRRLRPFSTNHSLLAIRTFTFLLIAGFILCTAPSYSQDIDEVMEGLESDFKFGGKEDVKQQNINTANESLREDASISNSSNSSLVDVLFKIHEGPMDGATISVEVVGSGTLVSGLDGGDTTVSKQLSAGSTQTLKVSCTGMFSCDYYIFIVKGALFSPSNNVETGRMFITIPQGSMQTLQIKINSDNSEGARTPPPLPIVPG